MSTVLAATSGLFRDRDFFVHDGTQLRRFRLSATIQIVGFVALMALVAWSSYAFARFVTPAQALNAPSAQTSSYSAEVAKLAAETERRVQIIEQRQRALAAALANQDIDAAALERLGFTPASAADGVGERVVQIAGRDQLVLQ